MAEQCFHHSLESPIGELILCQEEGFITRLILPGEDFVHGGTESSTGLLENAACQIREYFRGERKEFDLPLKPEGTDFMKQVWAQLLLIPYGKTASYGSVAASLGRPGASRAVGMANNRNPLPVLIPCHRVISSRGTLTGYRGGLKMKEFLLNLEKSQTGSC